MRLPKIIIRALILAICFILFTPSHVSAQNYPIVKDPNCDSIKLDPNYHSLRPFPFMPCDKEIKDVVVQCGNTVYASNVIDKDICSNCMWTTQPGNCTCNYSGDYSGNVTIDFSNSELPIVGNTEDVINWENTLDLLSDTVKVNDYVSWYLNGVINRAEYSYLDMSKDCIGETTQRAGVCLNTQPITGLCLSPNPVSPLLPPIPNPLLKADGINSCYGGKESCCVTRNPLAPKVEILDRDKLINFSGPIRKLLPQRTQDDAREKQVNEVLTERHNQIVACTYGINIPFLNWQIGAIPGRCLDLGLLAPFFQKKKRVLEWKDHLPPKREEFDEFKEYYKEYRKWRGDTCLSFKIPFLGDIELMLCFDDPTNPNFYGDLYPYIPYTTTEDRVGQGTTNVPSEIGNDNLKLFNILYDANDLRLYYAHMQETVELSDLLKKSFVPKEGSGGAAPTTPVEVLEGCKILDIRTNQGDHLVNPNWKWLPDKAITGTLSYDYDLKCEFHIPVNEPTPHLDSCKVTPTIPISLDTANPLHDELWSNLVADYNSPFRRIFPKLGAESSDLCLEVKDMPGTTKFDPSADGYSLQTGGEVYFPHLGGISEYFLKGIQTILRPKGYGEPIAKGQSCSGIECGELPDLPKATGSCTLGGISSRVGTIPQSLIDIIEAASQEYNTPPDLILGIMYGEGLFNPGRLTWNDQNVKDWATCKKVPGCSESGDDNFLGFNGNDWTNIVPNIKDDLLKLDPNRTKPSQCNLLDAIFGLAWNLHDSADGGMAFTCFGINLNASVPSSCNWNNEQYESAIKVHESGYTNMCLTKEGSCLTGGGTDAACPGGDTCETVTNRYPTSPSHNGCVWDVAHGN